MIRRFKDVSARTKILLFAFLFIILPSGILGYLGFRSIGNRGQNLKENYRSTARLMRDELQQVGAIWVMENFLPVDKAKK